MNIVSKIISFFKSFGRRYPSYQDTPDGVQGVHDCALRALNIVCPDIAIEDMRNSFNLCCDDWPYQGVTNKEFNISISYLKVKDRFQYCDDNVTLKNLLRKKKAIFIALIYGHFTVVYKGKIIDHYTNYSHNKQVFCYWELV